MSVDGVKPYSTPVSLQHLEAAQRLAQERVFSKETGDAFLEELAFIRSQGWAQQLPAVFANIQPPRNMRAAEQHEVDDARRSLRQILMGAGLTLSKLYKDGTLEALELDSNVAAAKVLGMFDEVRQLIPPPRMRRLEQDLFAPLRELQGSVASLSKEVWGQIHDPDLFQRLVKRPAVNWKSMTLEDLTGHSVRGVDRYQIGDSIRVRRGGDPPRHEQGEVIGKDNGELVVAVSLGREAGTKHLSAANVEELNPLKIGDWFETYAGRIEPTGPAGWSIGVPGLEPDGSLHVQAKRHGTNEWIDLTDAQIQWVAGTLARQLGIAAPGMIEPPPAPIPMNEGRQIATHAGGARMVAPEGFQSEKVAGALFTDRGIGYENYNEDAVAVGRFTGEGRSEVSFAIACDQAGGQGKIRDKETGAVLEGEASRIATKHLTDAAEHIFGGHDPKEALFAALRRAHFEIKELSGGTRFSAITTASAVVVKNGVAYGVNVGDSAVLHYGADGRLKNASHQDSFERALIDASKGDPNAGLGMAEMVGLSLGEPGDLKLKDDKHFFAWKLEPGDYLVTATDGLLDANLEAQKKSVKQGAPWAQNHGDVTMEHVGVLVKESNNAGDLAKKLLDYTTYQMTPDDPERLRAAVEARRAADAKDDDAGVRAAKDEIRAARGPGKPDNRGFSLLQFLG